MTPTLTIPVTGFILLKRGCASHVRSINRQPKLAIPVIQAAERSDSPVRSVNLRKSKFRLAAMIPNLGIRRPRRQRKS